MRQGEPTLTMARSTRMDDDLFLTEVVISWRWRCQNESAIIPGSALHIFEYPGMTLADWRAPRIDLKTLRCSCGGFVRAFAPIR
jgi:hypothetical protein